MFQRCPPLLALDFASPWMLWGLALAGLPIIIHLLHKRRHREVPWAAMRFLMEAARKNSRRLRLEQLLLLAVRTLILLFLVLALARPFVETLSAFTKPELPVHRIIVIDASLSMTYRPAEFSHFERARQIARNIVADSKQGDALNLVRIAGSPPSAVIRQPSFQKDQVSAEIDRLEPVHQQGDLFDAVAAVAELLGEAPEIRRKEVYLISDLQRVSFRPETRSEQVELKRTWDQISQAAGITLIDVGQSQASSAAVTRLTTPERLVIAGRPVPLQASLRNFGDHPLSRQQVGLYVDDLLVDSRTVDLPPRVETPVEFFHTFSVPGEFRVEVRLEDDALPVDNHRYLAVTVKDDLAVLLVSGRPSGRMLTGATDHLRLALSPQLGTDEWSGLIRTQVASEGELLGTDLARFDCVFLCNVRLFTPAEAELLEAYVAGGGAVVFVLGDYVQADNYNQVLFRDGQGLLPARLGETRIASSDQGELFAFDALEYQHPLLDAFRGNPDAGLEAALTFTYVESTLPANGASRVALAFDTGDPTVVEAPFQQGRVALITTSLDRQWGTWAVSPSFPPLMHELVHFLISGRGGQRQLLSGEPLLRAFASPPLEPSLTLKRPDGTQSVARLTETAASSSFRYDATDLSGWYTLSLGAPAPREEHFAVNVDPRECDLAKVSQSELQTELLAGVDFAYRTGWTGFQRQEETSFAQRGGVWTWLLIAALALLFVEQLMAWNFAYGLALLSSLVAFELLRQVTPAGPLVSLVVVLIAAACAVTLLRPQWRRRA